jgi:predicted RNA polymerase sigma factor
VALHELDLVTNDATLSNHHRLYAVRAHLLEQIGDAAAAAENYDLAARRTLSIPEQNYLRARARSARS